MEPIKSLDEVSLIAGVLHSVCTMHSDWLKPREVKLTVSKLRQRVSREGLSFLTIALPRLGKNLDKALSNTSPMVYEGFEVYQDSLNQSHNFPALLGELFRRVLDQHGTVLPSPCVVSVRTLRQVLYMFYKYDLPYADSLNAEVICRFLKTEDELKTFNEAFEKLYKSAYPDFQVRTSQDSSQGLGARSSDSAGGASESVTPEETYPRPLIGTEAGMSARDSVILQRAQVLLHRLFRGVDLKNITPRHGPGSVSTGEVAQEKYVFRAVPKRLAEAYPIDAYFLASLGHCCDAGQSAYDCLTDEEPMAKVVLVPKDSRGPRLISEEPLAFQWVQQGIRRVLYNHVESHPLTKWNVFFTNQQPNQYGALLGSKTGQYATLDLKDASDRVALWLVRLLFPGQILFGLEAARTIGTVLPSGQQIILQKFAPMGSALCFPIMALTIWSLLTATAEDTDTREGILVYGDDVIVPTAFADTAIETLEKFGLKANLDKCCIRGFFRESCGVDAFRGENVTPLRIRKLIPSTSLSNKQLRSRPEVYLSWLAYARQLWEDGYYEAYMVVATHLLKVYGRIPTDAQINVSVLSLPYLPDPIKHPLRLHPNVPGKPWFQRREILTWGVQTTSVHRDLPSGWLRLLRFFAEWRWSGPVGEFRVDDETLALTGVLAERGELSNKQQASEWSSEQYTLRRSTKL